MAYKSNSIEQSHNLLEIVACELSVKGGRDEGRGGRGGRGGGKTQ